MKRISILGSTGSIGKQALEVVDSLPEEFEIFALAAGNNIELLKQQIIKYKPQAVSVKSEELALELKKEIKNTEILFGDSGLADIAANTANDMVLVSVTGISGLMPSLKAIENGIDIALANKETLVAAGDIVMSSVREKGSRIIPVDSEHSAIYQCLNGKNSNEVSKLLITASGGPFRQKSREEIAKATVEQTLSHPKWSMGSKITVDSATLMNKGLEVIEAHHLFGIGYYDIEVVIHPQSILHSAVEFFDGSIIGQMGLPSMHIPIQYALTGSHAHTGIKTGTLSLSSISKLEFEEPDTDRFPCLNLAFEAGKKGGTYPTVLNAANEEAVYAFLEEKINLYTISKIVETCMEMHTQSTDNSLEEIISVDKWTRIIANELISKHKSLSI